MLLYMETNLSLIKHKDIGREGGGTNYYKTSADLLRFDETCFGQPKDYIHPKLKQKKLSQADKHSLKPFKNAVAD